MDNNKESKKDWRDRLITKIGLGVLVASMWGGAIHVDHTLGERERLENLQNYGFLANHSSTYQEKYLWREWHKENTGLFRVQDYLGIYFVREVINDIQPDDEIFLLP